MSNVRGSDVSVQIHTESSYGTATSYSNGQQLYIVSENVKISQQSVDSNSITGKRDQAKPGLGNINVNGSINVEVSPENMMSLLNYTLGNWATVTESTGSKTHTFKSGGTLPSFQMEVDFSSNAPSAQRFHLFKGLRVSAFNLQVPTSGYITAGFDVVGQDADLNSTTKDSTPWKSSFTQFQASEATISIDADTAVQIETLTLNVSNNLDESVYVIGNKGGRSDLPTGFCAVTGQLTAFFDSSSSLLTKANARTDAAIVLTLKHNAGTGLVGNEQMKFTIPRALLDKTSPEVSGPAGVKLSLSFKGYTNPGSTDSTLSVEIKNTLDQTVPSA